MEKWRGNLFQSIKLVHIELTTKCNARCPACLRSIDGGTTANPYINLTQDLSMEILTKTFDDGLLDELDELLICGNNGDALASEQLVPFLDFLEDRNFSKKISLHTNGGLGDKNTWNKLAQFFSKPKRALWFSVDGLEHTNHIYRRGVSWKRLAKNMENFIEAGGRAKWKYIRFQHNQDDIERARELASKMGFLEFQVRENHSPDLEPFIEVKELKPLKKIRIQKQELTLESLLDTNKLTNSKFIENSIECIAEDEQSIFIDSAGRLWPCCWLGYADHDTSLATRSFAETFFYEKFGQEFNNLNHHNWREILSHPWFASKLKQSFSSAGDEQDNPCFHLCNKVCGKGKSQEKKVPRRGSDYVNT